MRDGAAACTSLPHAPPSPTRAPPRLSRSSTTRCTARRSFLLGTDSPCRCGSLAAAAGNGRNGGGGVPSASTRHVLAQVFRRIYERLLLHHCFVEEQVRARPTTHACAGRRCSTCSRSCGRLLRGPQVHVPQAFVPEELLCLVHRAEYVTHFLAGTLDAQRMRRIGGCPAPLAPRGAWQPEGGRAPCSVRCGAGLHTRTRAGLGEVTRSQVLIDRTQAEVAGTLLTARLALERGLAVNTAGGTHHAFPDAGSGFCILNDLSVTSKVRRTCVANRPPLGAAAERTGRCWVLRCSLCPM